MPIPENLTREEFGAFVEAAGRQMWIEDLCFGAVLDGSSTERIARKIEDILEIDAERAMQIASITHDEAMQILDTDIKGSLADIIATG